MATVYPRQFHRSFLALGTAWQISLNTPAQAGGTAGHHLTPQGDEVDALVDEILQLLDNYCADLSRWHADSTVSRLAAAGGSVTIPTYAEPLFAAYSQLAHLTEQQLHPLAGFRLGQLGFGDNPPPPGRGNSSTAGALPSVDRLEEFFDDLPTLHVHPGEVIDIGAGGKGCAVDRVTDFLCQRLKLLPSDTLIVDASGDCRVVGGQCRIGLENPANTQQVLGVIELADRSCAASSPARRRNGPWHHIISALTGEPVGDIDAAWIVHDSCMWADLLATACFFTDPDTLSQLTDFEWAISYQGRLFHSPGFPTIHPAAQ